MNPLTLLTDTARNPNRSGRTLARVLPAASALFAVALLPALVMAADEAHKSDQQGLLADKKQGIIAGIVAVVLFVTIFAILAVKAWPAIMKGLDAREAKIKSEIEAAEQARSDAKAALEQYKKDLAEARAQAQKELEAARSQQSSIYAEMKARNEQEMATLKEKTLREIEAAKKLALTEIHSQYATVATSVAGKILGREVNSGDQSRFVDEALSVLGKRN